MFAAALVTVASVIAADVWPWLGFVTAVILGLLGMICASRRRGLAWLVCGGLATGIFVSRANTQRLARPIRAGTAQEDIVAAATD